MVDFEADLRKTKQNYLVENVVNRGYDTTKFAEFMNYKKPNGTDVDKWSMEELIEVVNEFYTWYNQDTGTCKLCLKRKAH